MHVRVYSYVELISTMLLQKRRCILELFAVVIGAELAGSDA